MNDERKPARDDAAGADVRTAVESTASARPEPAALFDFLDLDADIRAEGGSSEGTPLAAASPSTQREEVEALLDPSADGAMRTWNSTDMDEVGLPGGTIIAGRLREILALSHEFERRLGSVLEVNATDLSAMEHLINDGPLTPSDLAKRLGVTTAASTLVVDRLVGLGHVERRPHPRDRRKIIVVPAHASVARAVDELIPVIHGVAGLVGGLADEDRAVVERFLSGVAGVYRDAVTAPATVR